jgi:hypothetical protein
MSALKKLERDFQACVLARSNDMRGEVVGTEQASAEERVGVYVEGYRLRLLEILEDNFPGLLALLGGEEFDRLGRAYIDAYPSRHPSVRWFGQEMGEFLTKTPAYAGRPELAEMAAFELRQSDVFDAADADMAAVQDLVTIPPESWAEMHFTLHPSVRTLGLRWNVPPVWRALDKEEKVPAFSRAEETVTWLLWRQDLETHWRSLGADEAWAVAAVRDGKNFAELCEGLCAWHDESQVAMQAASLLKTWVTDGLIHRIETA